MRKLLSIVLPIFLGLLVSGAWAQNEMAPPSTGTEVTGKVQLVQAKSGNLGKDASGVVVWLDPLDGLQPLQLDTSRKTYRMVQHHKQFHPHLLVVPLGSVVVFPNLDPWFHNVFSLYRGKRFDLGLYEAGSQKTVRFDRLGTSYIFCNIHPEMMAVVLTVDTPFYTISDKAGHWSIPDVPPGRYWLHVWYENVQPAALHALERVVEVGKTNAMVATLSFRVTPSNLLDHKNKYGRGYDPKSLVPVY
jgi:plastocyanin